MSFQQVAQPKTSSNGFGRRPRSENRLQSGKSIPNRSTNTVGLARTMSGGKAGVYEGPSRDRLVFLTACLVGLPVEVQLRNGSVYSGTCFTTNIEKEFGIILKMARMIKDVPSNGQKTEFVSKAPSKTFIIPGKEVVQVIAKNVPITMDGLSSELQNERQHEIMIDSYISQSRHVDLERELAPWAPDEDGPQYHELENIFDGHRNRGWDQFEINKQLFGVSSTFDEELYTTKLERGPQSRELEKEAIRIAREIEGEDTLDLHLAEERGIHLRENFDIDEETRFSSVYRGRVDDSGYDEDEDIILDSRNNETFGDVPASSVMKSTDLTHGKDVDEAQLLARSSSVDEAECSQSSDSTDLVQLGSSGNSWQFASEIPSKNIVSSDGGSRSLDSLNNEHAANDIVNKGVDEEKPIEDAQVPKSNDSQYGQKDSLGKGEVNCSDTGTAPPSHASLKSSEKTSSPIELSQSAAFVKGTGEGLTATNNRGRTGSAASSNSERLGNASAAGGPGLSPSSSVGSLASEKSTLNPHAKEFKLNPNAKSFIPSQNPVRPPSPVSDGSFYYSTNVSTLPHLHGLPTMGIGMGPSFGGHQPVIVNPPVSPLQNQQAYYHPNAPQYGQQMLLGHHRPVLYMPTYQPEMQFKGRDY